MKANTIVQGSLAGLAATLPMTAAMAALHRQLPPQERYPLPPRQITDVLTEEAGVRDDLDEEQQKALTLANHFAYGAAAGALYGMVAHRLPGGGVGGGVLFGLGVWTASYLGWLPAAGILRSAIEHPARRNALMIAAHVVWGAATGWTADRLRQDR